MTHEVNFRELLESVANGSLSVSDADRKIGQQIFEMYHDSGNDSPTAQKKLRIVLNSGEDNIDAHIPLSLLSFGLELTKLLPRPLVDSLKSRGVDLTQLTGMRSKDLEEAIASLSIDLKASDGSAVRVYAE